MLYLLYNTREMPLKLPYSPQVMDLVCTGFDGDMEPLNHYFIDDIDEEHISVTDIMTNSTNILPIETKLYKLASVCHQQ